MNLHITSSPEGLTPLVINGQAAAHQQLATIQAPEQLPNYQRLEQQEGGLTVAVALSGLAVMLVATCFMGAYRQPAKHELANRPAENDDSSAL